MYPERKDWPRRHLASVPHFTGYDRDEMALPESQRERELTRFMELSVEMTGFTTAELAATRMARDYYKELGAVLGVPVRTRFLTAALDAGQLFEDEFGGPLARNLIRLWYLGQWKTLEPPWVKLLSPAELQGFDRFQRNVDGVISASAYQAGLAWAAIGTHPSGAKQAGFASWAAEP